MEEENSSGDESVDEVVSPRSYSPYWESFSPSDYASAAPKSPRLALDRISALKDSTLLHILSFLPAKDAVRTGTLSKRWQFLWTLVPTLSFRDPLSDRVDIHGFVNFVDQVLILHSGPKLGKFSVCFEYDDVFASRVDLWIRFAARRDVEELDLDFLGSGRPEELSGRPYELPVHLFNNENLTKLALKNCRLGKCQSVIYWTSLKNLLLAYVQLSDRLIEYILLGCPILEVLELRECSGYSRLDICSAGLKKMVIHGDRNSSNSDLDMEISAPMLHSLGIIGSFHKKFRLINVSSLVDVTLNFWLLRDKGCKAHVAYRHFLKELLDCIHHVKDLTIGAWCIKVLSIREVVGMFSPLSKRKYLMLDTRFDKWDLPGITSLLRSSPELEELVININSSTFQYSFDQKFIESYNFDGENYWTSRKFIFQCLICRLKTVKIVGFTGGDYEIGIVQFLLQKGLVLEKMIICTKMVEHFKSANNKPEELLEVARKMLCFPRASPSAVILFS